MQWIDQVYLVILYNKTGAAERLVRQLSKNKLKSMLYSLAVRNAPEGI